MNFLGGSGFFLKAQAKSGLTSSDRVAPGRGPGFHSIQGLEEACEDASRMVAAVRRRVDAVMGEVPWVNVAAVA